MRIIENSDNTNTYYSPIFIHRGYFNMPLLRSQGIYFLIFISDFMRLIFAGIFSLASDNQRFMRERNQRS